MRTFEFPQPKKTGRWEIFILSSILLTLFLFFIDEGYYNFNWMKSIGNWIAFVIYVVPIFICQLFVYTLVLKNYHGKGKILLSMLIGAAAGVSLVIATILARS